MVLIHPEYAELVLKLNDLKDEVARLFVERDFCFYFVSEEIQVNYMLKIGVLEYKLLSISNKYKQNLRKLDLIEEKLEKNNKINMELIEKKIKTEFKDRIITEQKFSKNIDLAIDATSMDLYDYNIIEKMNEDYFKLQKLYNPVFDLEFSKEKEKTYNKIEKYYQKCNYKKIHKLSEIYDENELFQDEIQNLKILKERYLKIIEMCERQIRRIKNSFPYNQKVILEDDTLCRRKKDSLNREIEQMETENKKIEKKIDKKLKKLKELP